MFRTLAVSVLALLLSSAASAQTTVWQGVSSSWNSLANWDNGVPTAGVDAVIANTGVDPSSFTSNPVCRDLLISSGAQLTLNAGFDLTVNGDLTVDGTLAVSTSSSDVEVVGNWVNNNVFTNGGGTVELSGSGNLGGTATTTFANLAITGGTRISTAAWIASGDVTVDGGAELNLGTMTHQVGGNWTSSAGGATVSGTGTIQFDGAGFLTTVSNTVPNVSITAGTRSVNSSSIAGDLSLSGTGAILILDGATLAVSGDANLTAGTLGWQSGFAGDDEVIDVAGNATVTCAAGTTSANSFFRCAGQWTSDATFAPTAGTVELDGGSSVDIAGAAPTFFDLVVASGTKTAQAPLDVDGDLTVASGAGLTLAGGDLDVAGAVLVDAGTLALGVNGALVGGDWQSDAVGSTVSGSGPIELTGTGSFAGGANSVPELLVSGGTRTFSTTTVTGDLTMTGVGTGLTIADDQTVTVGGNVTLSAGTLTFDDTTSGAETLDVAGAVDISATSGGTSANTAIVCGGNWTSTSAFAPAAGTVTLDGAAPTIDGTSPAFPSLDVGTTGTTTLAASAGSATVAGDLRVLSGATLDADAPVTIAVDLSVQNGATLDTAAAFDVDGDVAIGDATSAWAAGAVTHTIAGNLLSNGGDVTGTGALEFDGPGATAGLVTPIDVPHMTVTAGTRSVIQITVNGDLIVSGTGGLELLDNASITVTGNVDMSGTGTLAFDDVSGGLEILDVAGNASFDVATSAETVSSTIRVAGDWTSTASFAPAVGTVTLDGGALADATANAVTLPSLRIEGATKTFASGATVAGNLVVVSGAVLDTDGALDISGSVTLGDGTSSWVLADVGTGPLTHTVGGNWTSTGGVADGGGLGTIAFDGPGIIATGAGSIDNVSIGAGATRTATSGTITNDLAMTGGSLEILNDQTLAIGGDATLTGGTLRWTANTGGVEDVFDVEGDATVTCAAGPTTANSRLRVAGNWTSSNAFAPTGGVVELDGLVDTNIAGASPTFHDLTITGANRIVQSGSPVLVANDLSIPGSGLVSALDVVDVDGDVTLGPTAVWDLGSLTHTVAGNWTSTGGSAVESGGGPGVVAFDGAGSLSTGTGTIQNVSVTDGVRSVLDSAIVGDLEVNGPTAGVTILNDQTLTVGGDANLVQGTLAFSSNPAGAPELLDVEGDATVTVAAGTTTANSLVRVAGNWSSTSAFSPGSGAVELDGLVGTTIGGASPTFSDLLVSNATRTLSVGSPLTVDGDLDIASGASLDTSAEAADVNGGVSLGDATASWELGGLTHTVAGDWTSAGGDAVDTANDVGTVRFDGPGLLATGAGTIENVEIAAGARTADDGSVTFDLSMTGGSLEINDDQTLAVGGDANLTAGTLSWNAVAAGAEDVLDVEGDATVTCAAGTTTADSRLRVAGNWSSTSAFAPSDGTVELDGLVATAIAGASPTFAGLSVLNAARTVGAGSPVTVAGTLTIESTLVSDADVVDVDGDVAMGAAGSWDLGTLTHTVAGDYLGAGGSAVESGAGGGTLEFDGPGTTNTGGGAIQNVLVSAGIRDVESTNVTDDVDVTGGTVRIRDDATLAVGGNATFGLGSTLEWVPTVAGGEDVVDVEGDVVVAANSGASSTMSRFRAGGNWTSDAAFAPANGVLELDGAGATTVAGAGTTLPNLTVATGAGTKTLTVPVSVGADVTVAGGSTLVVDGALDVGDALTLGDAAVLDANAAVSVGGAVALGAVGTDFQTGGLTHTVAGNWTSTGGSTSEGGTIEFTGNGSTATGGGSIDNVVVSGGARVVNDTAITTNLAIAGGTLAVNDNATVSVGGDADLTAGALAFIASSPGDEVLDVEGSVTVTATSASSSPTSVIRCAGDWSSNADFSPAAGTVRLDGAGTTLLTALGPGFDPTFAALVLENGVRQVSADLTLDVDTLTVASGATLELADRRVEIPGSTINVDGDLTVGPGGELALGASAVMAVNATGLLSVVGAQGDPAVVGGATGGGGYFLSVDGTLEAGFFEFREMGFSGLVVSQSATIAPFPNDLRAGVFTFPDPTVGSVMLDIQRSSPTEFRYVDFDDPNGEGTFNVRTVAGSTIDFVNSEGSLAGEDDDLDPGNRVSWSTDNTVLLEMSARAGLLEVDVSWETLSEADVANFELRRGPTFGGPFTVVDTQPGGGSPYSFLDTSVVAEQFYVYQLYAILTHGEEVFLAQRDATPWGPNLPGNIFEVGPGGAFADVQSALSAVGATPNPIVKIDPTGGPYPAFSVGTGIVGTLRILGDGSGEVVIDTSAQAVQIDGLLATESVELSDLTIGDVGSTNEGILVTNCDGIVVLDELDVQGGANLPGVVVTNSDRVALQRSDLAGTLGVEPGLLVQGASDVLCSGGGGRGSLDAADVAGGSKLRTAELTFTPTVEAGSTLIQYPGANADIELPEFAVLNEQFPLVLSGEPGGTWFLILAVNFNWVDLIGLKWEMVGIASLSPFGTLASGPFLPGGQLPLMGALPDDLAVLGVPIVMQTIVVSGGQRRWSNVTAIIGLPF